MFDLKFRTSCINVYNELDKYNIKGDEKKEFISKSFDIHINSLYNWLKAYNNDNIKSDNDYLNLKIDNVVENEVINIFNGNNNISIKNIKKNIFNKLNVCLSYRDILCIYKKNNLKTNKKITKENIDKFIIDTIKINIFTTANEMIKLISDKFNQNLSTTYIYNILSKNGYSNKKIKINSNPYSFEKQKEQLKEIKNKISETNINNIISLDEISVKEYEHMNYGWSLKGKDYEHKDKNKKLNNKRYSVLMATSNKKIIDYTIVEKGIKTNKFNDFMSKLKRKDKENKNVYLLDNARVHKTKSFNLLKEKLNLNLIYNAPYQSKYNPIEYVFSLLRKNIQKSVNKTYESIITTINNFKKEITETKLTNIYNHVIKLLNDI